MTNTGATATNGAKVTRTKRILVVDDNLVIQEVLSEFLGRGYTVETVANASQALAAVVHRAPDLILLDVRIPGVDGLSLLRSFRQMGVTTPVFIITGYDSAQVADEAVNSGADAYLPKPFDLLSLDRLVAETLSVPMVYAV